MNIATKLATEGKWLDCITPLSDAVLASIRAQHPDVVGIVRSTPLPNNNTSGEVQPGELERILVHGFESFWYQRVRGTHATNMLWVPSEHSGTADGACGVQWAQRAGYPDGVHGFQDLEATRDTEANCLQYCLDWGATVLAARASVGTYVGYSPGLTPDALHELPHSTCYWHGGGGPSVTVRGYAVKQIGALTIAGVTFDVNVMAADALGGLPIVAFNGDAQAAAA
jgi:hypothetical protein